MLTLDEQKEAIKELSRKIDPQFMDLATAFVETLSGLNTNEQ